MNSGIGGKSDDVAEEREQQGDLPGEQERDVSEQPAGPSDMTDHCPDGPSDAGDADRRKREGGDRRDPAHECAP